MNETPDTGHGPDRTLRSPARRRLIRRILLGAAALSLPTAAYAGLVGPDNLRLTRLEAPIRGWPRELDGLRVGQITDTHCDCDHALERTARAVQLLVEAAPDLVLLTGDFVTVRASYWAEPTAAALVPLAAVRDLAVEAGRAISGNLGAPAGAVPGGRV